VEVIQCVLIIYLFKQIKDKDKQLDEQSEKRLEDVIDEREKYQELASDIEKSIDLLIKVLKKNGN
jgi:polyhydroxyalkanoate synthesis regulator phasin